MALLSKQRGNSKPEVSTASLPDIIFLLLIFFMVVTVFRDGERKVKVLVPDATQLQKLEQKSLVNHIWIGRPVEKFQSLYGTKPRIQLGDKFANEHDIPLFLEQHKIKVPEPQRPQITSSLKVDGDVTMGIVSDVKTVLRKSGQLKVNYSARPKQKR
jgi:biopolymer transport protein ExbD